MNLLPTVPSAVMHDRDSSFLPKRLASSVTSDGLRIHRVSDQDKEVTECVSSIHAASLHIQISNNVISCSGKSKKNLSDLSKSIAILVKVKKFFLLLLLCKFSNNSLE